MRFVADGMLGKLTRWLRILGHDVKYSNKLGDTQLITIAQTERRILLTRDVQLYRQATSKGIGAFYLGGKTEGEKLAQLAERFKIKLNVDMTTSRCPKCNTQVRSIPKDRVADKVEKSTFDHYNEFWECPRCGQIYWQGAHWTRIRSTLEKATETLRVSK